MNIKMVDFTMPFDHKFIIIANFLLGFIEGEGSFSVKIKI